MGLLVHLTNAAKHMKQSTTGTPKLFLDLRNAGKNVSLDCITQMNVNETQHTVSSFI